MRMHLTARALAARAVRCILICLMCSSACPLFIAFPSYFIPKYIHFLEYSIYLYVFSSSPPCVVSSLARLVSSERVVFLIYFQC